MSIEVLHDYTTTSWTFESCLEWTRSCTEDVERHDYQRIRKGSWSSQVRLQSVHSSSSSWHVAAELADMRILLNIWDCFHQMAARCTLWWSFSATVHFPMFYWTTERPSLKWILFQCKFLFMKSLILYLMISLERARQAANGMKYLSNKSIIHRDLSLRNLLVADSPLRGDRYWIKIGGSWHLDTVIVVSPISVQTLDSVDFQKLELTWNLFKKHLFHFVGLLQRFLLLVSIQQRCLCNGTLDTDI